MAGFVASNPMLVPCPTMAACWCNKRRCSKGVDPVLDYHPKLVAIDEEANHQIVHGRRFRKANGTTHKPLDPCPQIDVFTLDFLRILLAHLMLLWGDLPLVGAPSIRVKPRNNKRF